MQSVMIYDIQSTPAQPAQPARKSSDNTKSNDSGGKPTTPPAAPAPLAPNMSAEAITKGKSPGGYVDITSAKNNKSTKETFIQSVRIRDHQQRSASKEDCGEMTKMAVAADEVNYEQLKALDYYHGFVARQDLNSILKNDGDFIVRTTEVEAAKGGGPVKYDLILSLLSSHEDDKVTAMTTSDGGGPNQLKVRNVVIRRKRDKLFLEKKYQFSTVPELVNYYKMNTKTEMNVYLKTPINLQKWEYKHSDLDFTEGKTLGQGAYGFVKSGRLTLKKEQGGGTVSVAVKVQKLATGKDEKIGKEKIKEQMKEARVMRHLEHKNIVRLYGVAVLEQPLYIVLELINGGELKKYLTDQKKKGQPISILEKVHMCRGAACGLAYLHQQGYIHRDIAARNCLYVPDEKLAKLSDFGLSRRSLEYQVKKAGAKLPTKWLAPETLDSLIFYDKSDVYSFGVMMYEVFVDGDEPWPRVPKTEVRTNIAKGEFMQMPMECPPKLAKFVHKHIYVRDPQKRSNSEKVAQILEEVQTELEGGPKPGFIRKFFPSKEKNRNPGQTTMMTQNDD